MKIHASWGHSPHGTIICRPYRYWQSQRVPPANRVVVPSSKSRSRVLDKVTCRECRRRLSRYGFRIAMVDPVKRVADLFDEILYSDPSGRDA